MPGSQAKQAAAFDVRPVMGPYLPTGHWEQRVEAEMPVTPPKRPAGQPKQPLAADRPVTALYVPSGQPTQTEPEVYLPAVQPPHTVEADAPVVSE